MDDVRVGAAFRAVRIKRRWRQADLAARSGSSAATISRIERGHLDTIALRALRAVAAALDIRVDVTARWRAGELDRLINAKHSALHDAVATMFGERLPAWVLAPETSFAIYAERGVIDIVAWHPGRRALLIIELKTDISDVNELVGTVDRKRRLAREVVRERGWDPLTVSTWVIVAPGRTNRARVAAHGAMLRAAFPVDGRTIRGWLQDPVGSVAALSIWRSGPTAGWTMTPVRRVRVRVRVGGRVAG
ncbi:MAG: helix-turn-helix transcriptional regulator [Chloroflexota bacterium]